MHSLIETHRAELLALACRRGVTSVWVFGSMSRGDGGNNDITDTSDVDLLLAPMRGCLGRIFEYICADRACFELSRLVQDAVIRNLQTLTESSQRLSDEIKGAGAADSMARSRRVSQFDRGWLPGR